MVILASFRGAGLPLGRRAAAGGAPRRPNGTNKAAPGSEWRTFLGDFWSLASSWVRCFCSWFVDALFLRVGFICGWFGKVFWELCGEPWTPENDAKVYNYMHFQGLGHVGA